MLKRPLINKDTIGMALVVLVLFGSVIFTGLILVWLS